MENLKQELLKQIEKLTPLQQKQVLDFALELSGELSKRYPRKICFNSLVQFQRKI